MDNKMLFDATHPEETRVVVVRGNRVEEFDFEAENKKQLKGNIYLAKVTRVEPSLQAAFVDYGGNRHGFLAFSEIHPDYYQIPVADRQALLEEEAAAHKASDREDDEQTSQTKKRGRRRRPAAKAAKAGSDEAVRSEIIESSPDSTASEDSVLAAEDTVGDGSAQTAEAGAVSQDSTPVAASLGSDDDLHGDDGDDEIDDSPDAAGGVDDVESVGSEDALEEVPERRSRPRAKQYKIQEVIKRRQIILVQVVKEERGNKGAALTTYLSLAGRYSVLMPNTDRGGGISRKITNQTDRKRLRTIANDLDVPEGMGVILRTAGASRTKTEIKRDFEYLMRLWENVRDLTLKSSAPALVYEEGSLLKRSIRDLYNKDIDQILVAGEQGYREAKDFMRMLMPSHAKNVQPYKDPQPIFAKFGIETQLDAMFSPHVTLKSGGYIVINQTEALVSIDVNSGRSTRESSIEDTALSTNLETAEEVARQLRLRDLAGLIVIDFIDMEDSRNIRAVERKLKECLRDDRARIQVGRISHFGLLEMSRQRIRASVLESTMESCPHCEGTGFVRAPASVALHVLRAIEDYLNKGAKYNVIVRTKSAVALYVLNHKRAHLMELEQRFGLSIVIEADETIIGEYCTITRGEKAEAAKTPAIAASGTTDIDAELARDAELDAAAEAEEQEQIASEEGEAGTSQPKKRRRRRRGGEADANTGTEARANPDDDDDDAEANGDDTVSAGEEETPRKKRRRRGRRGGRRERERNGETAEEKAVAADETGDEIQAWTEETPEAPRMDDGPQEEIQSVDKPAIEAIEEKEPDAPTSVSDGEAGESAVEANKTDNTVAIVEETEPSVASSIAPASLPEAPLTSIPAASAPPADGTVPARTGAATQMRAGAGVSTGKPAPKATIAPAGITTEPAPGVMAPATEPEDIITVEEDAVIVPEEEPMSKRLAQSAAKAEAVRKMAKTKA